MAWTVRFSFFSLLLLTTMHYCLGQEYRDGQYPSSTSLFGVTYSPLALNLSTICLQIEQVETDMAIIREVADHVRLYSLAVCPEITEAIMRIARADGLRVMAGLFLSEDEEGNVEEVEAVGPLVEEYGDIIDAVIVGNEVLFSEALSLDDVLFYVSEVKAIVSGTQYDVPVTVADVWPVYESAVGPTLADAIDFVCLNIQPYWEGWDIVCPTGIDYECASAGNYVHLKADGLESYFGKPVWICESGWPTEGERCCEGRANARDGLLAGPSETNATIYISEIVAAAREVNRPTYIHAIFDEDWKRIWAPCGTCEGLSTLLEDPFCDSCELDYHWGVYGFDRFPKDGVTLPDPPTLK